MIENPMGTDGFEFIEYTSANPDYLRLLFERMGFPVTGRHRSKNVTRHTQGDINFIINAEQGCFAQRFAAIHGPSICAIAFRVRDARMALKRAVALGAVAIEQTVGPMELNIPAIEGIGGSRIYLVDRYQEHSIYDVDFESVAVDASVQNTGLITIDHLTHNVVRGRLDQWAGFYEDLFGFKEACYFDIEGQQTGLRSRAMVSPCGKIRIPINESCDDKSQIEEYLKDYHGEGIQHIALSSGDIYRSVDGLKTNDVCFQVAPQSYFDMIDDRVEGHVEDIEQLASRNILIDGSIDAGILLQIFTENLIGPIFFEIIQRKGNQGFGEGNFQALFESIEQDQIRRGVL